MTNGIDISNIKPNNSYVQPVTTETKKTKVEPVVKKNAVVSTKKSLASKFVDTFIKEDIQDVKSYIIYDVIIPGAKNAFLDGISMLLTGESGRRRNSSNNYYAQYRDYNSYSRNYNSSYGNSSRERARRREEERNRRDVKIDYRNIILDTREDAERVIDEMYRRIDTYQEVTVAEMLEMLNIASEFTDNNYGWKSKNDIGLKRVRDGYLLDVADAYFLG